MGRGRVAIIGDAAFVARPHCGAGVSKAADEPPPHGCIETNDRIENAIEAFSAERTKAGKAAVAWAAHLRIVFSDGQVRDTGAQLSPDRPPISPEYIIQHTGIELSEVEILTRRILTSLKQWLTCRSAEQNEITALGSGCADGGAKASCRYSHSLPG